MTDFRWHPSTITAFPASTHDLLTATSDGAFQPLSVVCYLGTFKLSGDHLFIGLGVSSLPSTSLLETSTDFSSVSPITLGRLRVWSLTFFSRSRLTSAVSSLERSDPSQLLAIPVCHRLGPRQPLMHFTCPHLCLLWISHPNGVIPSVWSLGSSFTEH